MWFFVHWITPIEMCSFEEFPFAFRLRPKWKVSLFFELKASRLVIQVLLNPLSNAPGWQFQVLQWLQKIEEVQGGQFETSDPALLSATHAKASLHNFFENRWDWTCWVICYSKSCWISNLSVKALQPLLLLSHETVIAALSHLAWPKKLWVSSSVINPQISS